MQLAYPETLVVTLEENYRSSASILQSAQVIIEQDESRPTKMLMPTHSVGCRPVLRRLKDAAQEALWIVTELKRVIALTGNLITRNDIAILVRSASLTRHIESTLAQHGITYRMVGGHKFYDRVEVKTVLDYLRVIQNPGNNDALARVVNVPPRKVGEATVKGLMEEGYRKKKTLWEVIKGGVVRGEIKLETKVSKVGEQGLTAFVSVILTARRMLFEEEKEVREDVGSNWFGGVAEREAGDISAEEQVIPKATLVDIVYYLMKRLCYREFLHRHYPEDHESRWANIEELVLQASDFTHNALLAQDLEDDDDALPSIEGIEQQPPSPAFSALDRFLANAALASSESTLDSPPDGPQVEQITLSTIHAAKGLEWPIVFIPGCYEGSIPHSRSEDVDEERRLLYVAMTRAMGLLYLSCPKKDSKHEKSNLSQFIAAPGVLKGLDKKGPSLGLEMARGILAILGRAGLNEEVVQMEAARLESLEDDKFPVGSADESSDEWEDDTQRGGDERMRKRVRVNGQISDHLIKSTDGYTGQNGGRIAGGFTSARSMNTSTTYSTAKSTMSSASNFSANTTTLGGFRSARGYLDDLRERKLGAEVDIARAETRRVHNSFTTTTFSMGAESSVGVGVGSTLTKKTGREPTKSAKRGVGQGSLLNFFGKAGTPVGGGTPASSTENITQLEGVEQKRQRGSTIGNVHFTVKDEFILLSSSPVRKVPKSPTRYGSSRQMDTENYGGGFAGKKRLSSPTSSEEDSASSSPYVESLIPTTGNQYQVFEGEVETTVHSDSHAACIPYTNREDQADDNLMQPLPPPFGDISRNDIEEEDSKTGRICASSDNHTFEPVLPKPLLTNKGSVNAELNTLLKGKQKCPLSTTPGPAPSMPFLPSLGMGVGRQEQTGSEQIIEGTDKVAPLFNKAAVKVITGQEQGHTQQKRTLGIRRSLNGWEARGGGRFGSGGTANASGVVRKTATHPPPHPPLALTPLTTPSHLASLKRLNSLLFPIPYSDSFYRDLLLSPDSLSVSRLAHHHGICIGAIRCAVEDIPCSTPPPHKRTVKVYIMTLGVLAPFRRIGVGRELVEWVKRGGDGVGAEEKGEWVVCEVYAHVWEANEEALGWYGKRGFVVEEKVVEGYYRRLRPAGAKVVKWVKEEEE